MNVRRASNVRRALPSHYRTSMPCHAASAGRVGPRRALGVNTIGETASCIIFPAILTDLVASPSSASPSAFRVVLPLSPPTFLPFPLLQPRRSVRTSSWLRELAHAYRRRPSSTDPGLLPSSMRLSPCPPDPPSPAKPALLVWGGEHRDDRLCGQRRPSGWAGIVLGPA